MFYLLPFPFMILGNLIIVLVDYLERANDLFR